jgi:lysophospholipase L1-like esterase
LRGGPLAPEKEPHELRLLFLGDSATFGMSVAEFERYPEQLADALRRRAPAQVWTAVDAGVVGYSVSQGLTQLPGLLERVQPDLVCLSFGINDCMLNPVSDAQLRELTTSTYERLRHALRSSQVVAAVEGGWAFLLSETEGLVTGQRRSLTRWLHYPRPSVTEARVVRVSVAEYLDCVERAERMCRERGVPLLLVTEYTSPEVRSRHEPDPAHHERIDRLYVELAAWARERGVPLADARGALRGSGVPPTELLLDSYHPSPAGYARIAAEVADTLEAAGWLERWRAR